jgi:hypothetical protein
MKSKEYQRFEDTMKELIKVPHSEIKAKLDAEKKAKKTNNRKKDKKNG